MLDSASSMLLAAAHPLVHVNASLNALATVLLVIGFLLIKQGRVLAHKRVMLAAFAVSCVFLVCYLWYHYLEGSVKFTHPGFVRYVYLTILLTHIVLAAAVPVLAIWTIYLGLRATGEFGRGDASATGEDLAVYRAKHRRLAWWTWPIWLYVSVTGVVVYVMLYHLWPSADL
jgi:uncharacterized membrane protein YozB (DUF420 family)